MPLCRLALGWKLLEIPYFLTNFVLWLLVSGAFLVVPGLQLGLVTVLPLAAFATYLPVLSSSAYQLAAIRAAGKAGIDIACGDGKVLRITELQAQGGKRMSAAAYLLGHPIQVKE